MFEEKDGERLDSRLALLFFIMENPENTPEYHRR